MSTVDFGSETFLGDLIEFNLQKGDDIATLYVYDDDRDVFLSLECNSQEHDTVMSSINKVTPFSGDGSNPYTPSENPSAYVLVAAAEAGRDKLIALGYRLVSEKRSYYQLGGDK